MSEKIEPTDDPIELTDIHVFRDETEDDPEADIVAYRAFAIGPDGRKFFASVKVKPVVLLRPTAFDEFVRATLEGTYRHLRSQE